MSKKPAEKLKELEEKEQKIRLQKKALKAQVRKQQRKNRQKRLEAMGKCVERVFGKDMDVLHLEKKLKRAQETHVFMAYAKKELTGVTYKDGSNVWDVLLEKFNTDMRSEEHFQD